MGLLFIFTNIASGVTFSISGKGLNPEEVREFNRYSIELIKFLPASVKAGLPQDIKFKIVDLKSVKKDVKHLSCSDTGKISANIPFTYSHYSKVQNSIEFDRTLFTALIQKSDDKLSDCLEISVGEFAKRSFYYELSRAYSYNQPLNTKNSCWKRFINRYKTGKLTIDGTLSVVGTECKKRIFNNENIITSKDFFQLTYNPRSTRALEIDSDRVKYFAREFSAYISQTNYNCERPSISSLMYDYLGAAEKSIKKVSCKDTNTFYLGMFPYDQRTIDKDFVHSIDLAYVKPRSFFKDKGKLYLKFNICKEALKRNKCKVDRFSSYWLGFKEEVEDLLISLNRKGYYARAFGMDDIVARRELSESLFKDYEIYKLALNRNEKDRIVKMMKELLWNSRSQYTYVSQSNLLEIQDIFSYGVESLITDQKYYSSVPSFIEMLKKNNRIKSSIPFESSIDELKYRYKVVLNALLKKNITINDDPITFLNMNHRDQLNMYHDWIQSTRDFASTQGLGVVKRRLEQKRFIQSFTFILDRSLKYKFLERRKELTLFLNKLSKSDIELDKKFKYYINQSNNRIPFYGDLISLTDYLSKRDKNQTHMETLIFDWSKDPEFKQKYPEVQPLMLSGIDLIETQNLLSEKLEEEVAQAVFLYRKSLDTYLEENISKIYRKDYSEIEKAAINSKDLKALRKKLKLDSLGKNEISDLGLRRFVATFLKKQDEKYAPKIEDFF